MKFWAILIFVMTGAACLSESALAQTYTDKMTPWNPVGKNFDVLCFSKENKLVLSERDLQMTMFKKNRAKFKNAKGDDTEVKDLNCIMEQKGALPVARMEFVEAMYRVSCDISITPFRRNDFRLLFQSKNFTTIKRLSDGKIWIIPSAACKLAMVLPSLKVEAEQEPVVVDQKSESAKP